MKALTLHQPWASLVALGVKTIIDSDKATKYRGPLAIHAGARAPRPADFGDDLRAQHGWIGAHNLGRWTETVQHADPCDCDEDEEIVGTRCMARSDWSHALLADEGAHGFSLATLLPLGAIVATCTLVDVVPIRGLHSRHAGSIWPSDPPAKGGHRLWFAPTAASGDPLVWHKAAEITDQRPYGDFSPGRYAWMLDDIKPTTERCPWCLLRGEEEVYGSATAEFVGWAECSVCGGSGKCDPVPARGRQGLWEWTP